MSNNRSTRRKFLQQTGGALAGVALAGAISQRAYAGEDNTIKIALVGCGGRGNGAIRRGLANRGAHEAGRRRRFLRGHGKKAASRA